LGEFSPFGRLFTLGSFLKVKKESGYFSTVQNIVFDTKKIWAIFPQPHLVTLNVS
jgi:hypothetical protein